MLVAPAWVPDRVAKATPRGWLRGGRGGAGDVVKQGNRRWHGVEVPEPGW